MKPSPNNPARAATRWNMYGQAVVAAGQFAVTLALVRLLEPAEFGRVALVYLVSSLVALLDDGGFSTALIAQNERRPKVLTSVFYQEVIVGIALSALVVALAPPLSLFYRQPDLLEYLLVLAPIFAITGPKRFYQTLFQRDLAFRGMAVVRMVATAAYIAVSIGMAVEGYGVWSLVLGLLARTAVETIGFVGLGMRTFRPGKFRRKHWRTGYGAQGFAKVGERFLNYLVDRLDVIVIGRVLGAEALGSYDVFKRLLIGAYQQVVPTVTRIAIPKLAAVGHLPQALAREYAVQVRAVGGVLFPVYTFCALFAGEVVEVVLGADWLEYVAVFRWLSVLLLLRSAIATVDALLMSRAMVKREIWFTLGLVAALAAALGFSVTQGLLAATVAMTAVFGLAQLPMFWWVVRPVLGLGGGEYFRLALLPLLLNFAVVGIGYGAASFVDTALIRLIFGAAVTLLLLLVTRSQLPQKQYTTDNQLS